MAQDIEPLIISDISGGRNGVDAPTSDEFPFDQCVEALNVDFRNGNLGRRRHGSLEVVQYMSTPGITGQVRTLLKHLPGNNATSWEIFMFDTNNIISRCPVGGACTAPGTNPDFAFAASAGATAINGVSFNGKLFLFYTDAGGQNRNVVYGPGTTLRYVGIVAPGAPTAANGGGAGGYPATLHYYRTRFIYLDGTTVISRSEPGPAVAFTPSGAHAQVDITKPATPALSTSTHWELEISADGTFWYVLYGQIAGAAAGAIPIATTVVANGVVPASMSSYPLGHPAGTYTLPPKAKFAITDGNRLIMFSGSRATWTPVLGSLDAGDDERIFQTADVNAYLDMNTLSGGEFKGAAQINGVIYAFKMKEIWRMTPTGVLEAPYIARRISGEVGAVSFKCVAEGVDEDDDPCIYFMSHRGPYRYGKRGLEYLGRDLEDVTQTLAKVPVINLAATVISHSVFHGDLAQWWVWFATGSNSFPNRLFIFDTKRGVSRDRYGVRKGWTEFTGTIAAATCSVMGPWSFDATIAYRPWVGLQTNAKVNICDREDMLTDDGTGYTARVKTRSIYKFGKQLRVGDIVGLVRGASASLLSLYIDIDSGQGWQGGYTGYADGFVSGVTYVVRFRGSQAAEGWSIQLQWEDQTITPLGYWELIQLRVPIFDGGEIR